MIYYGGDKNENNESDIDDGIVGGVMMAPIGDDPNFDIPMGAFLTASGVAWFAIAADTAPVPVIAAPALVIVSGLTVLGLGITTAGAIGGGARQANPCVIQ